MAICNTKKLLFGVSQMFSLRSDAMNQLCELEGHLHFGDNDACDIFYGDCLKVLSYGDVGSLPMDQSECGCVRWTN